MQLSEMVNTVPASQWATGKTDPKVVVRVFANGQYMTTCKIIDSMYLDGSDNTIVIDADLEIFEQEKK